jgi:hypothetical protein
MLTTTMCRPPQGGAPDVHAVESAKPNQATACCTRMAACMTPDPQLFQKDAWPQAVLYSSRHTAVDGMYTELLLTKPLQRPPSSLLDPRHTPHAGPALPPPSKQPSWEARTHIEVHTWQEVPGIKNALFMGALPARFCLVAAPFCPVTASRSCTRAHSKQTPSSSRQPSSRC